MGFDQVYSIRLEFLLVKGRPQINPGSSWYPHNLHVTVVPLGIACLAEQYYSAQGSVLSKAIYLFSPVDCIIPSSTES